MIKYIIVLLVSLFFIIQISALYGQSEERYSLFSIKREVDKLDAALEPLQGGGRSAVENAYGPGDYERVIDFKGIKRRYQAHVPKGYSKDKRWPVVLNFHGGGGRATTAQLESGMDQKADSAKYIAVYPDGTGALKNRLLTWNAGVCCGYSVEHNIDDVGFTRALLDDLDDFFAIDEKRIYASGLSNGAIMAQRLACELSDRIAAIAAISGPIGVAACNPKRPVSVIHFHGTGDENAPYEGGVGRRSASKVAFTSAKDSIDGWIKRNKCNPASVEKLQKGGSTIETYRANDGTEVVLVTIAGGGHTWPGGKRMLPENKVGVLSREISATDMMWEFFQKHPMK